MINAATISENIQAEYNSLLNKDLTEQDGKRLITLYGYGHLTLEQVNFAFSEDSIRFQGMKYKHRDFGLFEAIYDENDSAVTWLIQKGGHKINCIVFGNNRYMDTPTPLSYAMKTCNSTNMVRLLLSLNATMDETSTSWALQLQAKGDTTMINILKEYGFQEKKKNNDSGSVKENLDVVDVKTLLEQNKVLAERLNQIEKQMAQLLAERDKGVMPTNQSSVANSAIHYCHEAKPTASLPVQALINAQSATATTSTAVTPTSATTKLESSL